MNDSYTIYSQYTVHHKDRGHIRDRVVEVMLLDGLLEATGGGGVWWWMYLVFGVVVAVVGGSGGDGDGDGADNARGVGGR